MCTLLKLNINVQINDQLYFCYYNIRHYFPNVHDDNTVINHV